MKYLIRNPGGSPTTGEIADGPKKTPADSAGVSRSIRALDYKISPIFLKNSIRRLASASASANKASASDGLVFWSAV